MTQIVALIIGLILYYVLSNKDKKKTKPSQGPDMVSPPMRPKPAPTIMPEPEPAPMVMEDYDDYDDDVEDDAYQPVTFEDLLKQFGDEGKKPSRQEAWKRREAAARKQASRSAAGIGEEFIPAVPVPYTNRNGNSLLTAEDLLDNRNENFRLEKEKISYYANLFKNPQTVRDAVIMKEILDRKHFDI